MAEDEKPTADPTEGEIAVQPALPDLELPEYHGRKAVGMKTALNGAGKRITRSHEIGSRVVLLVEGRVKKAGHEDTDDGLIYAETIKAEDVFEIAGDAGKRLLSNVRQAYRTSDDDALGRKALPGAEGWTDGSGTALTPDELAEVRGDPVRVLTDERTGPVVVVFSDGARSLWPDEFEQGEPRPKAGDRFEEDGDGGGALHYVYATKLLHAETGETLDEWTAEQEGDRLLAAELAAVEAEAPGGSMMERAKGLGFTGSSADLAAASFVAGVKDRDHNPPCASDEEHAIAKGAEGWLERIGKVADAKTYLPDAHDAGLLRAVIALEEAGKNRKGLIELIARRIAEINGVG